MKLENLSDFILPIVILLFYFVLNMRKKKVEPSSEERPPPAPLQREQTRPQPPAVRRQVPLRTQIESRKISSAIEERSTELVSIGLSESIDIDPAYAQKKKSGKSNVQNLLKKRSLREVFLLKEILTRPYE